MKDPHVAYEIRHRECQPATRATDTFMVGFKVMDIGNRTGDRNIFKIGKRLCTNDEIKHEKLENIFVNSVNNR